jgi:2-C-methyl-D-erythritol 4-phosphate cytidylyltransferase
MALPRCYALVPAAGVGERAGTVLPKQYESLLGQPVLWHALHALLAVPRLSACLVVLAAGDRWYSMLPVLDAQRQWHCERGGTTRAASVAGGLAELRARGARDDDWVLVHDAARCLLRPQWVERLIDACFDDEVGGLLAQPLADTLKQADERSERVAATLPRADKWLAQTPQMFRLGLLERALVAAGSAVTDEASAIEALGLNPRLVRGDAENFKLTWPADFELAQRLLRTR